MLNTSSTPVSRILTPIYQTSGANRVVGNYFHIRYIPSSSSSDCNISRIDWYVWNSFKSPINKSLHVEIDLKETEIIFIEIEKPQVKFKSMSKQSVIEIFEFHVEKLFKKFSNSTKLIDVNDTKLTWYM
ncbi:hypothetical protein ACTA71_008734 [Dictyostelium dimigraforme]